MFVESARSNIKTLQVGEFSPFELEYTKCLAASNTHGKFQEPTSRNNIWTVNNNTAGITIGTNNSITGAALNPILAISNPVGSGVIGVILRATIVVHSGTLGAGGFCWGKAREPVGFNLTLLAGGIRGNRSVNYFPRLSFGNDSSGVAFSLLQLIGGPTTGLIGANRNLSTQYASNGQVFCPAGNAVGLFAASAGTSPVVSSSITWEEILTDV
jgi:hypothetical protein